ncbi:hypothetical protein TrRE_jg2564 [Triparma retinervis]|uniref:Coiled-coil domain-containing protein 86 n=1 Tax=Triparma retinervis TaxID=2557542 RepID=A0A9W7A7D1_9STRA|nr:hypothetical protein TrRE_jg2564 [Triparma retinervis]
MGVSSKLTVKQLRGLAKERGVTIPAKCLKADLITLLSESEAASESSSQEAPSQEMDETPEQQPIAPPAEPTAPAPAPTSALAPPPSKSTSASAPVSAFHPENFAQPGVFTSKVDIQKGRNVSGRSWRMRPQKRTSTLITKVKLNNRVLSSWEQKEARRMRNKEMKEREAEIRQTTADKKLEKKKKREEQEKRRAENQAKALKTQTMNLHTVGNKMKAMSKKQLRMIKKTQINKHGVVELVSPYKK